MRADAGHDEARRDVTERKSRSAEDPRQLPVRKVTRIAPRKKFSDALSESESVRRIHRVADPKPNVYRNQWHAAIGRHQYVQPIP